MSQLPVALEALARELREKGPGRFREKHGPAALLVVGFHAETLSPPVRSPTGVFRVEDLDAEESGSRPSRTSEVLLPSPVVGTLLPLKPSSHEIVLGRESDCDLVVTDSLVSRRHCSFRLSSSPAEIEDLGSRNGTLLDGVRLQPGKRRALRDGAILRVGSHRFRFITCESLCEKLLAVPARP